MSQTFYPIIGIPVPAGEEPPPRRDISSWSTSEDHNDQIQVSLFIRALHKMQKRNPVDNPLSYYQLAGVHGYPKAPWDNANVLGGFYCTHGVFTFPTWHRPYMLLYEQVLHSIMVNELVPGIPDEATKKEWTSAAQRWRLPFWDWAIRQSGTGEYGVPQIVQLEQVKVLKLGSKDKESVNNPLYKFTNKIDGQEVSMDDPKMGAQRLRYTDTDDKYASYFNKCIGTSRYADPDQESWVHGSVDNAKVRTAIEHPEGGNWEYGVSIAENVYRILSNDYFQSYETFSSTYFSDEAKKEGKVLKPMEYLSLEMIHNKIHNWTGGAQSPALGHMSDVPVAAFDPIFWLHHCNVDRLFAIWQYLNPDKWFDIPRPVPDPNTVPKPTDALPPFHINKEGKYYSSNDARYCERLGYTYPELLKLNVPHLKANLKNKYGKHLMAIKKPVGDENYLLPGVGDDTFPDYVINVEYDRFALGGNPYTVEFYLVTHNKQSQKSEHHTLGSFYNFTAPVVSDCENCKVQKNSGVKAKAQVPITLPLQGLVRRSYLDDIVSIEKSRVEKLLKHQLVYSVTKMSGEQIPPEDVPGLLVTVHAGDATYPTDDSLHVFKPHTYTPLWGATKDKPRGAAPS